MGFRTPLSMTQIAEAGEFMPAQFELDAPLVFDSGHLWHPVEAPSRFRTDLASVPRLPLVWIIACHGARQAMPPATVAAVAAAILPAGDSFRWHQALMDLGSTICTARKPRCSVCPARRNCASGPISQLALFHPDDVRPPEPTLCGIPRRFWRGKMVETLRHAEGGVPAHQLVDEAAKLLGYQKKMKLNEERKGLEILATLIQEWLAARTGVQEGELREGDLVMLPG